MADLDTFSHIDVGSSAAPTLIDLNGMGIWISLWGIGMGTSRCG